MAVTCYTVRPGPESGWLTFFEIGTGRNARGFFLILGPARAGTSGAAADVRRAAQEVARRVVASFKASRDPEPSELISDVRRHVAASRVPMEFGTLVATTRQIAFLVEGRVRVLPLTTTARRRWEREAPKPGVFTLCPVEAGDRFYLGRVPEEAAQGLAAADLVERLERGGAGDGALILNFLGAIAADAPAPPSRPESAPAIGAESTSETESAVVEPVPIAESVSKSEPVDVPTPSKPDAALETVVPPEADIAPVPVAGLPDAVFSPVVEENPSPEAVMPILLADWMAEPLSPATEPDPVGPSMSGSPLVERRMTRRQKSAAGFAWGVLGVAVVSLSVYLLFLRPLVRGRTVAPPPVEESPAGEDPAPSPTVAENPPPVSSKPGGLWETRLPGAVTGSPRRFADRVIVGCRDGKIYGLDAANGTIAWSLTASHGFGGTVALADSLAFLGGFDGIVRAFDPRTGAALWQYETGGRIMASPIVTAFGTVIAASYDHTLHALDIGTGKLLWKRRLGAQLWATPGRDGKYVYAPGLDGVLTSVNEKWGSVAWSFRAGDEIYSAPAVADGRVAFGCEDGFVYCLESGSGRIQWKTPVGKTVGGGVVAINGLFVVGDDAGRLHALDSKTGSEVWVYAAGGPIKSTPVVDEGILLFSSHDGYIHAVTPDGESIGRYAVDAPMASSPGVFGDSLFVGAHDGRVIAIRLR